MKYQVNTIFWGKVHLFLYSVIPFGFLVAANVALLLKVRRGSRSVRATSIHPIHPSQSQTDPSRRKSLAASSLKEKSINKIVFTTSFLFVLMTLPTATATFLFSVLVQTDLGQVFIALVDCVSLSFNAFNLFIYVVLNKLFRQEFVSMLKWNFRSRSG
jgi:hypothetical protein